MPVILQATDRKVVNRGIGWQEIGLADSATFGASAMIARCWLLKPKAQGPVMVHGRTDQLLYVIRGSGKAVVDGNELPLAAESVLWLEPGEQYQFIAGDNGLEILQGYTDSGI